MRKFGILSVLFVISESITAVKIVCYHSNWSRDYPKGAGVQPEDLDPSLCTHINYAFIDVNGDGSLSPQDEYFDIRRDGYYRVTSLKERNRNLKVLLSVGGGLISRELFASIAADPKKRAVMVRSARQYIETYNFDGIDLDWEVPSLKDKQNFITLLQDFRNDFDRNGWELSTAVNTISAEGYDIAKMSEILDHINLMTYDMYGPWSDYTGQNSPLYPSSVESEWEKNNLNMDSAVNVWIKAGADPKKLCAGIAFYGHTFTLKSLSNKGVHAPIKGPGEPSPITNDPGSLSYLEFCQSETSWDCTWDEEQMNPYCVKGDQWLGIDNARSIQSKVDYIKSKDLGGAMVWSIDQDDVHGFCGEPWPLLRIISQAL